MGVVFFVGFLAVLIVNSLFTSVCIRLQDILAVRLYPDFAFLARVF